MEFKTNVLNPKLKKTFSNEVIFVMQTQNLTCMEAILSLCEKHELDPGTIKKFITKPIKDKLLKDAIDLNLIKTDSKKLPI